MYSYSSCSFLIAKIDSEVQKKFKLKCNKLPKLPQGCSSFPADEADALCVMKHQELFSTHTKGRSKTLYFHHFTS